MTWDPDWAVLSTSELQGAVPVGTDGFAPGWLTYVSQMRFEESRLAGMAAAETSAPITIKRLENGGVVIIAAPTPDALAPQVLSELGQLAGRRSA